MIKCNECGLCRENCPVFRVVRRESVSPRGFAVLIEKKKFDKVLRLCSLCNNCKNVCPYDVDLGLSDVRHLVLSNNEESPSLKKIIENLRTTGNPYGIE